MSSLILLAMLASVVVEVTLSNGDQLSGRLEVLNNDGLDVMADGEVRQFARADVRGVRFPTRDGKTNGTRLFVQLVDDSIVPCDSVAISEGELSAIDASGNTWTASTQAVRAVRWLQFGEKTDDQWNEILGQSATDDLLVLRRGSSLDYLKGIIVAASKDSIQFDYSGNTIPVPLTKAAGFILAKKNAEWPSPRLTLTTDDGGKLMLKSAELKGDQLAWVTVSGVVHNIAVSRIGSLAFPQLGAVFLSDLEATSFRYQPYFGTQLESLATLNGPRFDVDFNGDVLRLASTKSANGWLQFRRGIALQSRTEIVYRLAGKYDRFVATAGIAPKMPMQADVEMKVFADERVIFSRTIKKDDEPTEIDVDVSSARRLKLLVDFGNNIDIGDQVHLGDARLVK